VKPLAVAAVASALLALLDGVGMSTVPVAAQGQPTGIAQRGTSLTLDEQLLAIAKSDPAFGGMFFDRAGRLTMYVQEGALAAQDGYSRLAGMSLNVESAFRGHEMMAAAATQRVQVLPARYGFMDLYGWKEGLRAADVFSVPGVVMTDIAEDRNRVRVGVERLEVATAVRRRLAARGIPPEAVLIEVTPRMRFMSHTLRSKVRPMTGGLQINFGRYVCTLGFLAVRSGVAGFVTNSHCTTIQGGNNNTIFHQPSASGTINRVGLEIRDPSYFTGTGCYAGKKCRYSDTAFARVPHPSGPSVTTSRGYIARPVSVNSTNFSINHTKPRFRITSENSIPVLNETLNKVGRTTGWSQGRVSSTCVDTGVSGTNIVQLCQDYVTARVLGGDSGSPVFRIMNSAGDVRLYGILWGGNSGGTMFAFSAFGTRNIQRSTEMGTLTTCASGYGC
jgi:hypothetical protein